ncbi:putative 1-phosphatidylinositol-3-phosphate 5-kinase FAB1D [Dichanthelium oligosanthes]|uniref:1-phosphatidylinositol-3-phosphate 5-kinase n=1 Tax=Dichanthelium oligosanthes TaxID=888268 RepID=A0A1E5UYM5_9POAL|nr:putative 1-phosphatidylinositol-3-phosphate 5-kinase FAB1D [Dichanthelium oligosanthes]
MCSDMNPHHHHATREAASEVLYANGDRRSLHVANHLGRNEPGDTNSNNHINHPSTDDNFSSNASLHRQGRISRNPSASSVDDRSIKSGDDSDGAESTNGAKGSGDTEISHLLNDTIWIPPEAADKEDEAENFDDDDDYSDGIKWGQSSFPSPGKEHEPSPSNPREEREKAMLEAMNGQLRILVSRFLASAGISSSDGEGSDSWLDIVTSLSWEAALLIKPDATVGKDMDPGSYIKVKCIASGTRRQSEVIKGLVFKKNAAHKHMPTSCHSPRLLLLKGVLGHSDVGLSSFSSMDQEKDLLERAISKMMEICGPNVVMVEKTVSRNIQELLLKEGVTLILDMKLNRLQRIARCTGSPISSFSEVLDKPKLKQCDYFHIEKFTEEHNTANEGGKMPSKTLMFLEGFPCPLGCTILLKGANSEELKKVKQVMHFTVFAAYHLILETSFFEDQRVFLNDKNIPKENSVSAMEGLSTTAFDLAALGGAIPSFPSHDDAPALRLFHAPSNSYVDVNKTLRSPRNVDAPSSITSSSANDLQEGASIRYDSSPSNNPERPVPGPLRKLFADNLCHQNIYLPVTSLQETNDKQKEVRVQSSQETLSNGFHRPKVEETVVSSENGEFTNDTQRQEFTQAIMQTGSSASDKSGDSPAMVENGAHSGTSIVIKEKDVDDDQADDALDSHSILILMSSQCTEKQVICEQSHLTRIKYYGNFDVSLGRLGSKVAMFRYSSVEIYATCKPQPILQFVNPIRQDWFEGQRRQVHARGMVLYSKVATLLQKLKNEHPDVMTVATNCGLSLPIKDFAELEELLIKEKANYEGSLDKVIDQNGRPSSSVHELLNINWSYQDLLLRLYIWDRRMHQLFYCKSVGLETAANCKNPADTVDEISDGKLDMGKKISEFTYDEAMTAFGAVSATESASSKLYLDHQSGEIGAPLLDESQEAVRSEPPCNGGSKYEESSIVPGQMVTDKEVQGNVMVADPIPVEQEPCSSPQQFKYPYWDGRERWIWNPIYESQLAYKNDIQVGYLDKFEIINHYKPSYLPPLFEQQDESYPPQFIVGPGSNILCVQEDEISSIIARALAMSDERYHSKGFFFENDMENSRGEHGRTMEKSYSFMSASSHSSSQWSSIGSQESEASLSSLSTVSSDDFSGYDGSSLLSSAHPEMTVNGKVTFRGKYSVTIIYANEFYELRKKCCPSELAYITSLSRCRKWDAQGGKSKAFFAKTMDDRFIIKQIKKTEFESFIEFAPNYFQHVYHSLDTGSQTCLAKILGIYQVKQIRNGKEVKIDLMVMENLLFGHNISRVYDLKGATFSRHVADSNDHDTVYLDQNYVEDMGVSPIYIGGRTKHLLQRAIWNDTSFLTSVNVMDYSLLVGVDKQKHELVFGIIDYLRQYTWDKQLETWVKTSLVVPKNVSPTVISPKEYKKRFRKFMAKYFLTVPDTWGPDNSSKQCKSIGHSNHKSVEVQNGDSLLQHPNEAEACS